MNLTSIVKNIKFSGSLDDREILYVTHDSRKVKEGTLFIAIAGEKYDGHDYIFEAIGKGAIAVIANGRAPITKKVPILQVTNPRKIMSKIAANFYENPSKETKIIAVTGTNGKSTCCHHLNQILSSAFNDSQLIGNIGKPVLDNINTGPAYSIIELSSFQLEIMTASPTVSVILNITPNHLDRHKTMKEYVEVKASILDGQRTGDIAVLGWDDYTVRGLRERVRGHCWGFSLVLFFVHCHTIQSIPRLFHDDSLFLRLFCIHFHTNQYTYRFPSSLVCLIV